MNTDKYEGHTEGPWELSKYTGVGGDARLHTHVKDKRRITDKSTVLFLHRRRLAELTKADTLLIVDAPLLLAEVKRKTALADALWDFIEANVPHLIHQATDVWNKHNEEAIE